MKKIPNNESIKLSPVKMYWDDLQEIEQRINKGRVVEVESGEYKYDNLEELKSKTKKSYINRVKIIGRDKENYNNRISVDIGPGRVWIHQDSESTETATKVSELLSKSSPWFMYFPDFPAWYMLIGSLGWIAILATGFFSSQVDNLYVKLIMPLFGVIIMLWTFKSEPVLGRTKIFTSLKKDKLNFWERNKDELLRELVIALIVGIISFLFGYFLPK